MGIYKDKSSKRGNRGRHRGYVQVKHPDGRVLEKYFRAATKAEAEERKTAISEQLRKELFRPEEIEAERSIPTLKEFTDGADSVFWRAFADKKASTKVVCKSALDCHLLPPLGDIPIDRFTPLKIEELKHDLRKKGIVEPNTINSLLGSLGSVFKVALELKIIKSAPELRLLPRKPPAEVITISAQELSALCKAAKSALFRTMLWLAHDTGLRRGELIALLWKNVNLNNALLTVRHSSFRGEIGTPKSGKDREIPLTPRVVEALQGLTRSKSGVVFVREDGSPYTEDAMNHQLKTTCKAAGVRRMGWHMTRHSFATNLDLAGVSPRSIQRLMGHSDLKTTERYLHTNRDELRNAIQKLDRSLAPHWPQDTTTAQSLTAKGAPLVGVNIGHFGMVPEIPLENPDGYPQTLSPSQKALFPLLVSLGASYPLVSSPIGPTLAPGIYTGEALCYAVLELAELKEMGVLP